LIDLGPVEPINQAVEKWRETYGGNVAGLAAEDQPGMKLRRLVWEPLEPYLGIDPAAPSPQPSPKERGSVKTVLISPDGEVAKFPWSALPGSKPNTYLIEDGIAVALIPVPQMLPDLLGESPSPQPSAAKGEGKAPALLILGDVNYDAAPDDRPSAKPDPLPQPLLEKTPLAMAEPHRSAIRGKDGMQFSPLPGTAQEIQAIGKMYQERFGATPPLTLTQSAATTQRLRQEAPQFRYLHLATHGFFAPVTVRSALAGNLQSSPAIQNARQRDPIGFNPGLLSGIALSGANRGNQRNLWDDNLNRSTTDDGILTALEVAALDLRNVDLAVLSACETGLGQASAGEGMLGLQRAFQLAGARTTVTSLWSVDDAATQTLMSEFYSRLWDRQHPLGKLAALREAQLAMLQHYDPRTKQLVHRAPDLGRGAVEVDSPAADADQTKTHGRLSPKYWAAFELSGDWR
jgi:CHAT domain-containing protein